MFNIFSKILHNGIVTEPYPALRSPVPVGFRGRHAFRADLCDGCGDCVPVCPSRAIEITALGEGAAAFALAYEACVFCGRCTDVCPQAALPATADFELATMDKADLRLQRGIGPAAATVSEVVAAAAPVIPAEAPEDVEELGREFNRRVMAALGRSLHIRHLDSGSCNGCDFEIMALLNPFYDVQRFGIDFVASPRHADMLLVTGPVTRHLEEAVCRTYDAAPARPLVVAVGACACSGGVHQGSYAVAGGVDQVLPVDAYIPGCPPRPEAILHGLLLAIGRL